MAFTFLKAKKYRVGSSLVDNSMIPIAKEILKLALSHIPCEYELCLPR